jgi:hypothetical protein
MNRERKDPILEMIDHDPSVLDRYDLYNCSTDGTFMVRKDFNNKECPYCKKGGDKIER